MVDKEQSESKICYHEIQEKDQEDLDILVQRELLQMQRIHSIQEDRDHESGKADCISYSPANSPKPKVKVPEHRDVVAKWMNEAVLFGLEIVNCEETLSNKQSPGPRLFTLAASLMDIFLMKCKIKLSQQGHQQSRLVLQSIKLYFSPITNQVNYFSAKDLDHKCYKVDWSVSHFVRRKT